MELTQIGVLAYFLDYIREGSMTAAYYMFYDGVAPFSSGDLNKMDLRPFGNLEFLKDANEFYTQMQARADLFRKYDL